MIKFMTRIRSKVRIAGTSKDLELGEVWGGRKQLRPGRTKLRTEVGSKLIKKIAVRIAYDQKEVDIEA